jgi:geranylgeranyl diphosphate synthase type I
MSDVLLEQLDEARRDVNAAIRRLIPDERRPQELYTAARHLIEAGGKRLRPFLVMKSCTIVGGENATALPIAAALEFVHTFTLVHDDVMDADKKRRGVPTVHVKWGIPIAIAAGDMLFAKAYEAIGSAGASQIPPKRLVQIFDVVTRATINICEGQALDMLFATSESVTEADYLTMIGKKTAALLVASAEAGALAGGGTPTQVKRLGTMAYNAGLAFQIVDDILGLDADETVLGKPVGSDIREGKKTLIVLHALSHADEPQRARILSLLGKRDAPNAAIHETIETIRSLGSIDYATTAARNLIDEAKEQLNIFSPSPAKAILTALCDYLISRRY